MASVEDLPHHHSYICIKTEMKVHETIRPSMSARPSSSSSSSSSIVALVVVVAVVSVDQSINLSIYLSIFLSICKHEIEAILRDSFDFELDLQTRRISARLSKKKLKT